MPKINVYLSGRPGGGSRARPASRSPRLPAGAGRGRAGGPGLPGGQQRHPCTRLRPTSDNPTSAAT